MRNGAPSVISFRSNILILSEIPKNSMRGNRDAAREIRCQFIILARKDEPTPDYARHRITPITPQTPGPAHPWWRAFLRRLVTQPLVCRRLGRPFGPDPRVRRGTSLCRRGCSRGLPGASHRRHSPIRRTLVGAGPWRRPGASGPRLADRARRGGKRGWCARRDTPGVHNLNDGDWELF